MQAVAQRHRQGDVPVTGQPVADTVKSDESVSARRRRNPKRTDVREDGTRRCIVTGDTLPREQLLRFVAGPDDIVVPDLAERLPGRGLWLHARRDIVREACVRNAFSRAARRKVTPLAGPNGETLAEIVETQLGGRCLDIVSLARRAGIAVAGYDQVRQWLKSRPSRGATGAALLLCASDAADGGRDKLAALAAWDDGTAVPVVRCDLFSGHELGKAFGRDHLVHVLIAPDRLTGRLLVEIDRFAGFGGDEATGDAAAANDVAREEVVAMDAGNGTVDDRSD